MNLKSIAQKTFDTKLFIVYSVFFSVIIGMLFVLSVLIKDIQQQKTLDVLGMNKLM
ncbi:MULTISPECIES: hypothetical protein [Psychrobacillus]|uniref:hypothetical protein n=1 Tax=Psychrobacillus TaxID=1221880 RepID=UPI0030FA55CC